MSRTAIASGMVASLLLAACVETPEPADPNRAPDEAPVANSSESTAAQPSTGDGPDECGAAAVQDYVGRQGTEAVEAELEAKAKARFRWLPPGTIVTQDYVESRMNVELDEAGVIVGIRCG